MTVFRHSSPIRFRDGMILRFPLNGPNGFAVRQQAADYLRHYATETGAERGSHSEQSFGLLAEAVVRRMLRLPTIANDPDRRTNLGYDILSPTGVKIDVKCRGGKFPFSEFYPGTGGLRREAKHNFFARQVFDARLDTDLYLMTHLQHPDAHTLPGTEADRGWCLYVCGWISKARVAAQGLYLPKGSWTEQGRTWFQYRAYEIEVFQHNLNPLESLDELLSVTREEVQNDEARGEGLPNITSVDVIRIAVDLVRRGLLSEAQLEATRTAFGVKGEAPESKPFHSNQYAHLARWLHRNKMLSTDGLAAIERQFVPVPFTGI